MKNKKLAEIAYNTRQKLGYLTLLRDINRSTKPIAAEIIACQKRLQTIRQTQKKPQNQDA